MYSSAPYVGNPFSLWSSGTAGQPTGAYMLVLQDDGSLAIYEGSDPNAPGRQLWSSSGVITPTVSNKGSTLTTNQTLYPNDYLTSVSGAFMAIMQTDGNFVVYRGDNSTSANAIWASRTYIGQGSYMLTLHDNGSLATYEGSDPNAPGRQLWSSPGTTPPMANKGSTLTTNQSLSTNQYLTSNIGGYMAIMQGDGNFVVYKGGNSTSANAIWSTQTGGQTGGLFLAVMQEDGNFVVYRGDHPNQANTIWASNKVMGPGSYILTLNDNGVISLAYLPPPPHLPPGATYWSSEVAGS